MKKKTGASAVSIGIAASLCVFIFGGLGLAVYNYMKTDRSLLASEGDKLSEKDFTPIQHQHIPGLNMPLTRSDNWHQIASEPLLEHEDFAGIDGSTATLPITAELARQFFGVADEDIFGKYAMHNKTDVAYDNLIHKNTNRITLSKSDDPNDFFDDSDDALEKEVHLIFATPPSEDEIATAKENGVSLDAKAVALDGFVFLTHKDNPVDSLTVEQIQDIYTGKITNWKEVGGRDEKIRAFQRTKNSGSQTAMEELVMQGKPMQQPPVAFVAEDMGGLVEAVAEYENETAAIGYSYYYYLNNLYKSPDIKVLAVDGITPDNENLISESYPFTAGYYAVIRSDEPEDSVYRKLRDYMLTDEGQEIISLAGYCPVREG